MKNSQEDIIAAIATPIGEGGLSIIRISGKGSIALADRGFRGKASLKDAPTYTVHYGSFVDLSGNVIDEVLMTIFRSPHSYTTEDSVEISCHGGIFVTRKILDSVLNYGARLAEPGEFTKRAFLNGRIDLSQAEAVADIIQSRSESSHKTSLLQLQGKLSINIQQFKNRLLDICSMLELELDFSEEGIEITDKKHIEQELETIIVDLERLATTYDAGKLFREGIKVVLTGRPNVGKSSILNILLDENRAIVTHVPGTTRDVIEENITIEGILFRVVDTAGLRQSSDVVEAEGIRRSEKEIRSADIILFIIDLNEGFIEPDILLLDHVVKLKQESKPILFVFNKIDLSEKITVSNEIVKLKGKPFVQVSAKTNSGIELLKRNILELSYNSSKVGLDSSFVISNLRHKEVLVKSINSLQRATKTTSSGLSNELIAIDIRDAMASLAEITGEISTDDILNNIFSRFCIGK